jgi:hypothetical protein
MSVVPLLQLLVLLAVGQLLQDASAISIPRQETEAYSRNSTRQLQDLGGLCTTGHILSDMETACCGAGQAGNGGHRRVQAECEGIPTSCSQECAPMFINYYETCQESVISLFDRPKREAFAALFGECRAAVQNMCVHDDAPADTPTTTHNSWQLAMNINPSDRHNFGWGSVDGEGGWPVDGNSVGFAQHAFTNDYMDSAAWHQPANFVAIVRHEYGQCNAARVWQLQDSDVSLFDYFKDGNSYPRAQVTTGGPVKTVIHRQIPEDPIFGAEGDLVFNWFFANNGARIALTSAFLSQTDANDDDTHGLGAVHTDTSFCAAVR